MSSWILTLIIFLPLAGALLIALAAGRSGRNAAGVAAAVSLLTLALTGLAVGLFLREGDGGKSGGFVLQQNLRWVGLGQESADAPQGAMRGALDVGYRVGIDGISLWLVVLTALLSPVVILSSATAIKERQTEYYSLLLALQTAMTGVFCATDLLLFFVFFEFTLVPLYLIIGVWGGPQRRRAANKFFIYTFAGSVLTFLSILYIAWSALERGQTPVLSFSLEKLYALAADPAWLTPAAQWWLFVGLFAGFAIKVPLFPLHTWLPLAHTEAPTGGSVLLAAVLLKLGTYGFLRVALPLLPGAAVELAPSLAVLSIIGILYGALVAWVQDDVKKLVAYSSVSHLGFCVLGLFTFKIAGLGGAVLYMISHGLSTGALFLLVGMIYERYHTRDIGRIGGLARPMPWLAFFLIYFTLVSIGLPGLSGFVGEFMVLIGTALSGTRADGLTAGPLGFAYAVPAALGIILGAVYMLWMCQRVLFGPLREPPHTPDESAGLSRDLNAREKAVLVPLAVCALFLGVYPRVVLDSIEPAVRANVLASRAVLQTDKPGVRLGSWSGGAIEASIRAAGRRPAEVSAALPDTADSIALDEESAAWVPEAAACDRDSARGQAPQGGAR
jgi:NADH-quinone oxidoreductase subunit M